MWCSMDNTLDSLSQPKISPARPMTLEERLMELLYGNEGLDYENQKKLRLSEQHRAQAPVTGLNSPIPGANPEVPTGADALVGALMSMGGVPPAVARSGSPRIQRPAAMRRPGDDRLLPEGGKIGDSLDRFPTVTDKEWVPMARKPAMTVPERKKAIEVLDNDFVAPTRQGVAKKLSPQKLENTKLTSKWWDGPASMVFDKGPSGRRLFGVNVVDQSGKEVGRYDSDTLNELISSGEFVIVPK